MVLRRFRARSFAINEIYFIRHVSAFFFSPVFGGLRGCGCVLSAARLYPRSPPDLASLGHPPEGGEGKRVLTPTFAKSSSHTPALRPAPERRWRDRSPCGRTCTRPAPSSPSGCRRD